MFTNPQAAAQRATDTMNYIAAEVIGAATRAYGAPLPSSVQRRLVKAAQALAADVIEREQAREAAYGLGTSCSQTIGYSFNGDVKLTDEDVAALEAPITIR